MAPAITDLLEAGRARARDAFAERMPRGLAGRPAPDAGPLADRPWEALRPEVAAALRPELPALADDIVAAVSDGVPDQALPRTVAALAVEGEEADRLAVRLGADALVAPLPSVTLVVLPDPDAPGRRRELAAALRERRAALGPVVSWPEAGVSFARAHRMLELVREGAVAADALAVAEEHQPELVLGADRRLSHDLAARALAPLDGETDVSRERLSSTLEAWLRHRGRTEQVAQALHVHPQTVRYRLAGLRDLFGERLDAPDGRFELELVLRARRLLAGEG